MTYLSKTDWILLLTLISIVWYSIETRLFRKWQTKSVQMSVINLQTNIKIAQQQSLREGAAQSPYITQDFPETIRKVYEDGVLDLREIYSMPDKKQKKFLNNLWHKIIFIFKK